MGKERTSAPQAPNKENMPTDNDDCEKCGDKLRNGSCRQCDTNAEDKKKIAESLARVWGGHRASEQYNLENLKHTEANADAITAAKEYTPETQNLFIFGPTGTGKSHIAVAAMRAKYPPLSSPRIVWKPTQVARFVRACQNADNEEAFIRQLATQKSLIIDDLGVEKPTEFITGLMYEIIEGRDMNRPGGLIVTSNLSLDDLANHLGDDRITSRLAGMCKTVNLMGETIDWRQERGK